jgi:hypothetical protein
MTVREGMLPSAMVPGLVTIEDKKGRRQNLYPIDAKELLNQQGDEYSLVENGAIEVARLAATPLRSGMAAGLPKDQIIAEVSGIEGKVLVADSAEEAEKVRKSSDNADAVPAKGPTSASEQDSKKAAQSASQPKSEAEKKDAVQAGAEKK